MPKSFLVKKPKFRKNDNFSREGKVAIAGLFDNRERRFGEALTNDPNLVQGKSNFARLNLPSCFPAKVHMSRANSLWNNNILDEVEPQATTSRLTFFPPLAEGQDGPDETGSSNLKRKRGCFGIEWKLPNVKTVERNSGEPNSNPQQDQFRSEKGNSRSTTPTSIGSENRSKISLRLCKQTSTNYKRWKENDKNGDFENTNDKTHKLDLAEPKDRGMVTSSRHHEDPRLLPGTLSPTEKKNGAETLQQLSLVHRNILPLETSNTLGENLNSKSKLCVDQPSSDSQRTKNAHDQELNGVGETGVFWSRFELVRSDRVTNEGMTLHLNMPIHHPHLNLVQNGMYKNPGPFKITTEEETEMSENRFLWMANGIKSLSNEQGAMTRQGGKVGSSDCGFPSSMERMSRNSNEGVKRASRLQDADQSKRLNAVNENQLKQMKKVNGCTAAENQIRLQTLTSLRDTNKAHSTNERYPDFSDVHHSGERTPKSAAATKGNCLLIEKVKNRSIVKKAGRNSDRGFSKDKDISFPENPSVGKRVEGEKDLPYLPCLTSEPQRVSSMAKTTKQRQDEPVRDTGHLNNKTTKNQHVNATSRQFDSWQVNYALTTKTAFDDQSKLAVLSSKEPYWLETHWNLVNNETRFSDVRNGKGETNQSHEHRCEICNSTFPLRRLLNRHLKTHAFYKRYSCSYCSKGFNDTFDLKRHIRTHTGIKPFKCNLCDKGFTQRCSLEAHQTRVHGVVHKFGFRERRVKMFVCEDCGATFRDNQSDFMNHIRSAHPERHRMQWLQKNLRQNSQIISF